MKILFINKGDIDTTSGGYIYNKNIIQEGLSLGIDIKYSDEVIEGYDLHVVDSLMFGNPEIFQPENLKKTIALVHQFPINNQSFIEQKLSIEERNKMTYIVTGDKPIDKLSSKWSIKSDNIFKIIPGIEDDWIQKTKLPKQVKSLIMVANYIPNKGYDNLTRFIPVLNDLDLKVNCFGNNQLDPSFYAYIKEQVSKNDTQKRISINPKIDRIELNNQYLKADLFISLSENESFGMAVYEAICCGLPAIIFKTGEWQQFQNYKNVLIVKNGDINQFMSQLLTMKNKLENASITTIDLVIKHTWGKVANDFFDHCKTRIGS